MTVAASPLSQSDYQVRFDWGVDGMRRLTTADVVIVVDVLGLSTTVTLAAERGERSELAAAGSDDGAAVARAAAETSSIVVAGGLRNSAAVARFVLAEQAARGERTSVAIVAAGERMSPDDAAVRMTVEDQLGAGAIIAALGDLGIDHCSPEAAVTGEGFRGLRGATRHLLTASGSGRELTAAGRRDDVLTAAAVDAASVVPVLRDGVFAPA